MLSTLKRLAATVLGAAVVVLGLAAPALAARTCTASGDTDPNTPGLQYGCIEWSDSGDGDTGGGGGGGGGGTPAPDQCTFFGLWSEFCQGTRACYMNDPAAIQDIEKARKDTPGLADQPEDADHLVFTSCKENDAAEEIRRYVWDNEIQTVSILDRITAARGALVLPTITPVFNPPTRTLVNLETWWWAQGVPAGEVVGTPALGMRAIASPRGMTVTAGSQTITCPIVNQRSDQCAMTLRRAGQYTATMSITYDIRFEMGGSVIPLPAGVADLATMTATGSTALPVLEVQSLVTDID